MIAAVGQTRSGQSCGPACYLKAKDTLVVLDLDRLGRLAGELNRLVDIL